MTKTNPDPWAELLLALTLLAKHQAGPRPFHCEHDQLYVMSDPAEYTKDELDQLKEWGFHVSEDDDCFYSFRFGSA